MANDFYIADGKTYTRTTQNRRTLKLKEWGINESIFRTTVGSSAENIYPGQVFLITTDAYGSMNNGNGVESDEKIAILSGSYVECMFMKPEERMISVMERQLNGRLVQDIPDRKPVQCMNFAMSGTHLLHAIFVLLAKIIPMNVKAVVYVLDINEFRASSMSDGDYYTSHKNLSIFAGTKKDPRTHKPNYTHFRKFIRDFWSICKIHGIHCIFAGRTYAADDKRASANNAAKTVCESLNCDYIDLGESIKNKLQRIGQPIATENYNDFMNGLTYDTTHLTPRGAAIVGDALADEVFSILFNNETQKG